MRENKAKRLLQAGQPVVNGWLAIPSSLSTEIVANCDFDAATVDLQHGLIDFSHAVLMMQALSTTTVTPIVRPTSSNAVEIMHLLDAGAYGVICPQVDDHHIAEAVVAACKYPPMGSRSFGPPRGVLYGGNDYFHFANDEILVFVMIESKTAVANLDRILDVPGIDGVFVGPNDLSLTYGGPVGCEPGGEVGEIVEHIRAAASSRGYFTGIYCTDGEMVNRRIKQGFQLVNPGNDSSLLKNACNEQIAIVRSKAQSAPSAAY
ncbi:HpcH/HpaI aldolase family protein [Achromobacter xylosoxidans]|uniref:HpcH/HpaI aldolase family protein n=1 Tax=Alcaligenes xylosoxydans xylosoxydans TaxID=85698 RepID=UPI001F1352C3|nr:aldolase/citrate lyase family protein [Achromobacter xylosoxidans]